MAQYKLLILLVIFSFSKTVAQVSVKAIDSDTGEPLPYAGMTIGQNGNLMSNSEGVFTLASGFADSDAATISFLGYHSQARTVAQLRADPVVRLKPGAFQLGEVYISKADTNADSIMAKVRLNIDRNYKIAEAPQKSVVFYRTAQSFRPRRLSVKITEATGIGKHQLKALDQEIREFTGGMLAHPPSEFSDMLCNYYTARKIFKDKPVFAARTEVLRAVKLKDPSRAASLDEIAASASGIVFRYLDSTKYYRVKSGLFGSRDTLSLRPGYNHKGKKVTPTESASGRSQFTQFYYSNRFGKGSTLDFVTVQELYRYTFDGAVPGEDGLVYIIRFVPAGAKAKYSGTLYINEKDYCVVRADFALSEGKTMGGVNLKFLLGVKQSDNVSRGTIIYKRDAELGAYYLKYAVRETGQYIYINRPLKFVEITDGDKDKFGFHLKLETDITDREEYYCIAREAISESAFDSVKENTFSYLVTKHYDAAIWKELTGIEPEEAMRKFSSER